MVREHARTTVHTTLCLQRCGKMSTTAQPWRQTNRNLIKRHKAWGQLDSPHCCHESKDILGFTPRSPCGIGSSLRIAQANNSLCPCLSLVFSVSPPLSLSGSQHLQECMCKWNSYILYNFPLYAQHASVYQLSQAKVCKLSGQILQLWMHCRGDFQLHAEALALVLRAAATRPAKWNKSVKASKGQWNDVAQELVCWYSKPSIHWWALMDSIE